MPKRPAWTHRRWWGRQSRTWVRVIRWWRRDRPYWLTYTWWKTWYTAPNLDEPEGDETHLSAVKFLEGYQPARSGDDKEDKAYETALKYAERYYDQAVKLTEVLDKKLDDLMRNAGVLGGIIASAAKFLPAGQRLEGSWMLAAPLFCLVAAVVISALTRGPANMAIPAEPRALLEVADLESRPTKGQLDAIGAALYNVASAAMNRVNIWKSTQLKRTTALFCLGVALLLFVMIIGPLVSSSTKTNAPLDRADARSS